MKDNTDSQRFESARKPLPRVSSKDEREDRARGGESSHSGARPTLVVLTIVLLGAAFRLGPLFHDLWLDEVWSVLNVRDHVETPLTILTRLHTDNNHPLNSFWIFLLGDSIAWPLYRLPAYVAGVLSIPLSGLVMKRFGTRHAVFTMILVACSYPLIVYSTEARGYGLMLLFLLLALECIGRHLETGSQTASVFFWAFAILGFLSHLTFSQGYAAIFVYSIYELRKRGCDFSQVTRELLNCHGVPCLFLAGLYFMFIRHIQIAGAEPNSLGSALGEMIAMMLGVPELGLLRTLAVVLFLVLLFEGIHRLKRKDPGWQWLFCFGMVFFPLVLAFVTDYSSSTPLPLFPRYFLTSLLLALMLFGFLFGELSRGGRRERLVGGLLLGMILAGNLVQAARFTWVGRGQYAKAVSVLAETSSPGTIHIGASSDFRTRILLEFYSRCLPRERRIQYHPRLDPREARRIDWWIFEILDPRATCPRNGAFMKCDFD